MGWTVLYIAFGVVALWLLGEVLLQYKARLRWRLLAFTGFVGVVAGALIPSIVVIGIGIGAFATGQTFVTLSYRRGFSTGWALGGRPGSSRRRRGGAGARQTDPALQVSGVEADGYGADGYDTGRPQPPAGSDGLDANTFELHGFGAAGRDDNGFGAEAYQGMQEAAAVYQPGPLPEDTDQYGGYATYEGQGPFGAQDGYGGYDAQHGQDDYAAAGPSYGFDSPQNYAPYSDPYIAYDGYDGYGQYQQASFGSYDAYGNATGYDQQGYPYEQHPYAPGDGMYGNDGYGSQFGYPGDYAPQEPYYSDTPPGGVFFPQQRDPNSPLPPDQPQPQHQPYDNGYYYDEQRGY